MHEHPTADPFAGPSNISITLRRIAGASTLRTRIAVAACGILIAGGPPLLAQATQSPPPLTRWIDVQTLTVSSRYRFIENSDDRVTSNQLQYKESIRTRFNVDRDKRVTVNAGFFSGSSFISTWNNWGAGTGSFDGRDNYLKQLYLSVAPRRDLEFQGGGIYLRRGEDDDITTYDDDGYVVGGRVTIRQPRRLYVDEVTVTRGTLGPFDQPNLIKRWGDIAHPNYAQVLVMKRVHPRVAGSLDYSTQSGADTIRAAVTVRLPAAAPVTSVRYEQYRRVTHHAASGFALWGERTIGRRVRLQAGYVTIDRFYGGWNADRIQSGRRLFAIGTIPIRGGLSAQLFATQALASDYPLAIRRRVEVVLSYDLVPALRRAHLF
jgi:hypothetical protein